jgi:hypothetical protein
MLAAMKNMANVNNMKKGKVPVLNQTPRHDDVLGEGDIGPRILDLAQGGGEWSV